MKNLNLGLAIPAIVTVLFILLVSSLYPDQAQDMAGNAMTFVTDWFGWLVQLGTGWFFALARFLEIWRYPFR